jgi:hypothetical protein
MAFKEIQRGSYSSTDENAIGIEASGIRFTNKVASDLVGTHIDVYVDDEKNLLLIIPGTTFKVSKKSTCSGAYIKSSGLIAALNDMGVFKSDVFRAVLTNMAPDNVDGPPTNWLVDFNVEAIKRAPRKDG